jgi:hypothetical protein
MMKPLYALAISVAMAISWSALAETTVSTTSRSCKSSAYGAAVCTETTVNSKGSEPVSEKPLSAAEQQLIREEKEARIRKWQDFCKPAGFIDEMGITRLRYAHPGCDLGRSDDATLAQVQ